MRGKLLGKLYIIQINTKVKTLSISFCQGSSSEADGRVTVAFLPTMNVVSGLLQDGELTHEQSVKVCSF